jgi:hypothetical protein
MQAQRDMAEYLLPPHARSTAQALTGAHSTVCSTDATHPPSTPPPFPFERGPGTRVARGRRDAYALVFPVVLGDFDGG